MMPGIRLTALGSGARLIVSIRMERLNGRLTDKEPSLAHNPNHASLRRRTSGDTEGDVSRVMRKLEDSDQVLLIEQLLANSSNVFRPYMVLSDSLLTRGQLPRRLVEIVILFMANARGVSYEWAEHVPMAEKAGVTRIQIGHLASGQPIGPPNFTMQDSLATTIAHGLINEEGISDENWSRAFRAWGEKGALDLMFIAAWWGGFLPMCIAGLGLVDTDRASYKVS
jgi:hypothetical protein